MNKELEKTQKEVETYTKKIIKLCKTDSEIDELYKGTQIWFSPIKIKPKFMFLGINPGPGYFNYTNKRVKKFEPLEKSEYETEEYTLQAEWKSVFTEIGKIDNQDALKFFYKSPKTNISFLSTKDANELHKLKAKLKSYFGNEYDQKEKEWIRTIIAIIQPEYLLCEGFEAFNSLQKLYTPEEFCIDSWEDENFTTHKVADIPNNVKVIGFKRCYSNLSSKDDAIETIYDFAFKPKEEK